MASAKKTVVTALSCACASASLLLPLSSLAATPVVFWDGSAADYNFSTLTRTVGDNTYTLNLNEMNTVGGDGSYIQIGDQDKKTAVTLTVQNADPAVTNGFGTAGELTVVMKCRNIVPSESAVSSRGLIGIMDGMLHGADNNGMKLGIATRPGNAQLWFYRDGAYNNWSSLASAPTAADYVIAATYDSESNKFIPFINGKSVATFDTPDSGFTTPTGIILGGIDKDDSNQVNAQKGMKIEAVAVYTNCLSEAELKRMSITVSAINDEFGDAKEITVQLDDGAIVFGDVAFSAATNVKFVCDGSITVRPPANNTTVFDFSGVTGKTVISYTSSAPTASGDTFTATTVPTWVTNSTKWAGTIALSGISITGPNFNDYGNTESSIRMSGVTGWINTGTEYIVPIVFENGNYDFALKITNGNSPQSGSNANRCSMFRKISGRGNIVDGITVTAKPVFKVYDASEFCGSVNISVFSIVVCAANTTFDDTLYNLFVANANYGTFYIASGKAAALADGKSWTARRFISYGSLTVNGTLAASVSETFQGSIAGSGRIVASGYLPSMSANLDDWTGTTALSNVADASAFNVSLFSSTNSTLELTSIGTNSAHLVNANVKAGKVVLIDDGNTHALALNNGFSDSCTTFSELAGTGTLSQSKADITQGLTVNVMTNFSGTLSLNNMSVTFGTQARTRSSGLYIDSDAVLSVPAGFSLWAPAKVIIGGPVNFTTTDDVSEGMVLFDKMGSNVEYGENFNRRTSVSINGVPVEQLGYSVVRRNGQFVTKKIRGFAIRLD